MASGPVGHRFDVVLAGADPTGHVLRRTDLPPAACTPSDGHWHVPGVVVRDEPGLAKRGMIEGFYGAPWTAAARTAMMRFAGQNKMNSYVYAPKLDPYHREKWRDPVPRRAAEAARRGGARPRRPTTSTSPSPSPPG